MRRLLLIGMGAGDPEYLTVQAINALNEVDVFFVLDKGPASSDLAQARRQVCERFIRNPAFRTVTVLDPPRDRRADDYAAAVDHWRTERGQALEQALATELGDDQCGGFLVWGDPSLYDGTIRVVEEIVARGALTIDYAVIPGISSIQSLAAAHRIILNRVAGPVHITTGRRLLEGLPDGADDIVVMLDADLACRAFVEQDIDIYWGAYLGTADEVLLSGKLRDVIADIDKTRRVMRERKGWIMDTYLLRRRATAAAPRLDR